MTFTSPRLKSQLRSVITLRVISMNLQGTGKFKGFFFNKQEIYTTVFVIEIKFGNFKWIIRKLFDECRQFLLTVQPYKEEEFQTVFPREIDITDDVFILIERKESMEKFLEGVVATMDFLVYRPLFYFLNSNDEISPLVQKIKIIQATIRMFLIQRRLHKILLIKYKPDIQKLTKLLRSGIRVTVLSPETQQFEPVKKMLWLLPNSSEIGLNRLCCTTYAEFFAYIGSQDEDGDEERKPSAQHSIRDLEIESDSDDDMWGGKFDGIYLSDIAEVRKGPASYRFGEYIRNLTKPGSPPPEKTTTLTDRTDSPDEEEPNPDEYVDTRMELSESDCVVIVGSERGFDIQFLPESFQELYDPNSNTDDEDDKEMLRHYARDWFVDTLSLMAIQSLSVEECSLRNRVWSKCLSEEMSSQHRYALVRKKLGAKRVMEAAIFRDVMVGSIQVDEEICDRKTILRRSPTQFNIEPKVLWYDQGTRRIYIQSIVDDADYLGEPVAIRGVDLDDIAEIRPGRVSYSCDGSEYLPSLTIVGTETSISLPLDSVAIRNALLRQFQSFLTVYRNPDRSAYIPSQIPSTPFSNLLMESNSKDDSKLILDVEPHTPHIESSSNGSSNLTTPRMTPSTILSTNSHKPTRRKSTPASLNKSYTLSTDSLFVHLPVNQAIEASPIKQLSGSVPKDFFSPTRHSAGAKLKSQSVSIYSPIPGDSPNLKKLFSDAENDINNERINEEIDSYPSGEKSGLAMTLEFDG